MRVVEVFACLCLGALTRGALQARAGMDESDQAPIERLLLGMWKLGFEVTVFWALTPLVMATGGMG